MTESKSDQVEYTRGSFVFSHANSMASPNHKNTILAKIDADKVQDLFSTAVRSRDLLRRAVRDGNLAEIGFAFGWLDSTLTEVAQLLLPSSARKQMVAPMSGGGRKPTDPE